MTRGRFITFEGIDGAGKSSHVPWLAENLRQNGIEVLTSREPGGTSLGEKLRELLLNEPMHIDTETLLMFAARREHLDKVIEPALAQGVWVLCDRFTDATHAYQGGGRGLDKNRIGLLETWTHGHLQPDMTFLFDLPCEVARERIALATRTLDRFEMEKAQFHDRVRHAYLERASHAPGRFRVIDANQSREAIQNELQALVASLRA